MWVTPEQIEAAKQIDLLSYLETYDPDNLQKIGTNTYCTKEHDSLKISNGLWHWFSRHIGGKNALDYLIKVKGFSFTSAVMALNNSIPILQNRSKTTDTPKSLELPDFNSDIWQVKCYLMERGIDERIIEYCHKEGMLFEDEKYHNCVFLGLDESSIPKYGALRSTTTNFKRDLDGSDKRYSFKICPSENAGTLHIFEAVIDLLSHITLSLRHGIKWYYDDYLSLGGVYATDNKQDIPLALRTYLERHTGTKAVYLHLDNDEVGRMATKQITEALSSQYTVIDQPPQSGKDFNDYLKNEIQKEKRKEQVR